MKNIPLITQIVSLLCAVVAVGAVLCGAVRTGKGVLVGANAVVLQGLFIGDYAVIGAGVTARRDVLPGEAYYGV